MTEGQRDLPVDPNASIRADLLDQIAGAQVALEASIEILRDAAALGGDSGALVIAQNQLGLLGTLQQRIVHVPHGGLAAIRAEVAASVAAAQTLVQEARASVASAKAADVALQAASAAAHQVTGDFVRDFYERKIFDKYLDFASSEDGIAYREREEARRRAIDEARAAGTPQGELRATELQQEQLRDAGAHGATESPDYQPWTDRLKSTHANLQAAMSAARPPDDISQIPADPLAEIAPAATVDPNVLAALRASGVVLADQSQGGHGVNGNAVATSPGIRLG